MFDRVPGRKKVGLRSGGRRTANSRPRLRLAATPLRFEPLEPRMLLSGFTAYNDAVQGSQTHSNATAYTDNGGDSSGLLKDITSGADTSVLLSTSGVGHNWGGTGGSPAAGTDAGNIFGGYVDFTSSMGNSSLEIAGADSYTYDITNLDPGNTYEFAGTAVRGNDGYTDRWTRVTLLGADSLTAAHSSGDGIITAGMPSNEVVIWVGANHQSSQGFVVQWTDITPGVDGQITVISQQYTGAVPTSIDPGGVADGNKGYGLAGIRLIENVPSAPPEVINHPATNIEAFAAELHGEITNTGGQAPNTTIYYGDNDGLTNPLNWDHSINLGPQTGTFSEVVGGLDQSTPYYFRAFVEQSIGSNWAPTTESFTTLTATAPSVVNLPATHVGAFSAWLEGQVTDTGNDPPLVTVYYGTTDGGTDPGNWADSIDVGVQSGVFIAAPNDLDPETPYYFSAYAQNAVGGAWAAPSLSFETTSPPPLRITEFMADNATVLYTRTRASDGDPFAGDNASPDWIEIHNPTDATVILDGYHLTDDLADPTMWAFPSGTSLEPGDFLVVFASGDDVTDPDLDENGYLHTNFKLQDDGEDLALTDADGVVVFAYDDYPVQSEDVSYGVGDEGEVRFFANPTPGWDNANEYPRAPEFTVASTTFTGSIVVDLIPRYPTDTVHYTVNETVPTAASPVWPGPTAIADTTMLRAVAIGVNSNSSVVTSQTYLELGADMLDDNTNLPIVIVQTFGDGIPGSQQPFGDCFIAVIEPGEDGRSRLTDPFVADTRGGIHIRGSSSAGFTKKQYRVELWDESNEDRKLELLGMPTEADWIFYGPGQYDRALISNPLMYDLSNQIDRYAVRTRWVEMYLDTGGGQLTGSDYYGVYAIMEVIERGDDRVDIESLSTGSGGLDVKGGFAWKNDKSGMYVDPESPNGDQKACIDNYMNTLNNAAIGTHGTWANLDSFVDHNLLNMLSMNVDALRISTYYFNQYHEFNSSNQPTGVGYKMEAGPIWDFDRALDSTDGRDNNPYWWNGTGDSTLYFNDGSRVKYWWPNMFQDPDFVQMYIDRWFELRDGQFSVANIYATMDAHAAEITEAAARDYARWYNPRYGDFAGEIQHMKDWLTNRVNWVDSQWVARPTFNTAGPVVTPGTGITLSSPHGPIYYTLDGTDPRAPGGAGPSGTAILANHAIPIYEYTQITARVFKDGHVPSYGEPGYQYDGDDWSAPIVGEYFINPLVAAGDVVITEINYHPVDATPEELATQPPADPDFEDNDFEYVEFENVSGQTVNIRGVSFKDGIQFTFGSHVLADGDRIVVTEDLDGFTARYGINGSLEGTGITAAGVWQGELNNKGEQLTLLGRDGSTLLDFAYDDGGGWPNRADGGGSSLELKDPSAVPSAPAESTPFLQDPVNWRSSIDYNGSPGAAGAEPSTTVLLNEILAHSDLPYYDRIELYNATGGDVDVAGWFLSDAGPNYFKFVIPPKPGEGNSHWLAAGGYAWFDENDFNATGIDGDPGTNDPNDFALSSFGDDVWLISADEEGEPDEFVDHVDFDATITNVSLGRLPNGNPDSDVLPLAEMSFGAANGSHRVGEAIISEVHYNPAVAPDAGFEFIELYNNTGDLLDLSFWRISDAVDVVIPEATTLIAGEAVVLVDFDPGDSNAADDFRAAYGIGLGVQLIGPWDADDKLDNGGEKITLQRRNDELEPGETNYAYITVDQVDFDDDPTWPAADGTGDSLTRLAPEDFGNDPASWIAAEPTPGSAFLSTTPHVVDRHVFYNNSAFDGNDAAANSADDGAIAPDKEALLPEAAATLANYTSYSLGINGIMVDIANLQGYTPVAGNFAFMAGNSDDPGSWTQAPDPSTIAVREGFGTSGSDRVTLIWTDRDVRKEWLQVTVKADTPIGLTTADVFYFGNAVAEAGNSTADAQVTTTDLLLARNNPRNFTSPATIDFDYDYNRDDRVNATDVLLARNNQTNFLTRLSLIDLSDPEGQMAAAPDVSPDALGWLYDFEQLQAAKQPSKKSDPAKEGVDRLLATYAQ